LQDSIVGRVLHTLIGYMDQPTGMELVACCGTILAMLALMQVAAASGRQTRAPGARAIS
jgi:high-affinity iron transporter